VVPRAVPLVKYPAFNPVSFRTGGDGRASRCPPQVPKMRYRWIVIAMGFFSSLFGCRDDSDKSGDGGSGTEHYLSEAAFRENMATQARMTPRTLEQLRKHGVTDDSQLALEFFFYTDTETKAAALANTLAAEGYSVKHGASASDDETLVITGWSTKMTMDELTVVDWTKRMCRLGFDHDCDFDGWGTKPNQD